MARTPQNGGDSREKQQLMRLYCCLNPPRRARERATRGRLASHVVIAQGMRRTRACGRPSSLGRLACARSRPQVASRMEDGAVWINKHLDILPYGARVCRDGRSSGLGTSAKILCPHPEWECNSITMRCVNPDHMLALPDDRKGAVPGERASEPNHGRPADERGVRRD